MAKRSHSKRSRKLSAKKVRSNAHKAVKRAMKAVAKSKPITNAVAKQLSKNPRISKSAARRLASHAVSSFAKSIQKSPKYRTFLSKSISKQYLRRK